LNVYPSAEELMPSILKAKLPASLVDEIAVRYETLGDKYLTEAVSSDGRRVNGMMFTDRIQNCREEIVDAVFCILGQIFKDGVTGNQPDDNLYFLLEGLIEIYSGLAYMEESKNYVVSVESV
jgi:hypothetical protein